jgi:hypothetical protein
LKWSERERERSWSEAICTPMCRRTPQSTSSTSYSHPKCPVQQTKSPNLRPRTWTEKRKREKKKNPTAEVELTWRSGCSATSSFSCRGRAAGRPPPCSGSSTPRRIVAIATGAGTAEHRRTLPVVSRSRWRRGPGVEERRQERRR